MQKKKKEEEEEEKEEKQKTKQKGKGIPNFSEKHKERQKCLLREQCEEIEGNNRMGKTSDLFKKTRDTKGTFHAKMGSIKDTNGMDLTEAEDIIRKWQEYTEELYKGIFMTQIITMV